ncbi:hypothetical protein [Noviherbaspirillum soli]|uniref:hypothetical protein n=1 Tax=Noviherbaspirillum soli TaxID=1064518 RepID=UPI00188BD0F4|nr:hypothetical protein [Noviherbaspirillum soli]
MARPSLCAERLLALFAAGWLLLNYPFLALFGRLGAVAGIPALYLYLFVAWALLIAGIALVLGPGRDADDGQA